MYESPWGCFSVGFIIFSVAAFLFVNIVDTAIHSTTGLRDFLVTFGLIIIVILIAIHHFQKAEKSRVEVARNNAELEARNEAGRKRYQHEVEIYQQLYYCERDDVVFKLGRPETCAPASQVNSLYEFL